MNKIFFDTGNIFVPRSHRLYFFDTTGNSFEIFLEEEKYFSYLKPAASGMCHSVLIIATKMGPKVQIAAAWARHSRQAMTATGRCNGRRREGTLAAAPPPGAGSRNAGQRSARPASQIAQGRLGSEKG